METKEEKVVKFRYIFPDNYNPAMATGALGGPMPDGHHIAVSFYMERLGLPYSQTFQVGEDGKLGNEVATDPNDARRTVIRFVSSGVVLTPDTALAIAKFLQEQVANLPGQSSSMASGKESK
jgi:hypothetical protein